MRARANDDSTVTTNFRAALADGSSWYHVTHSLLLGRDEAAGRILGVSH